MPHGNAPHRHRYVVVTTPEGDYANVSISSSYQGGVQTRDAVKDFSSASSRKVVTYTPGDAFDKLHISVCGRVYGARF
jgi:hypothetical protein